MLPNSEDISPKLRGSKIFSKLDAASGFHQIPLDEESRLQTTFITPFGRFCFKRLPFRISFAPEIFQRRMTELQGDIGGVQVIIDDLLMHGRTMEEHDERLEETLELNPGKREYGKSTIRYFGHIISNKGIQPCKEKNRGDTKVTPAFCNPETERFLGITIFRQICAEFSRSTTANRGIGLMSRVFTNGQGDRGSIPG